MIRLALYGHGRWGTAIQRTLQAIPDVSVVVVGRGKQAPTDIDGALFATPVITHARLALPFIRKAIPVFIEKPLTDSVADAKRLESAARKSGSLVHVGHIHLHNPAFLKAKELAPSLGPIRYLMFEGLSNGPFRNDVSVLWDWLPHPLSMALELIPGGPKSVQAWGINILRPRARTHYDIGVVRFDFKGATLLCTVDWVAPEKRTKMTIVGKTSTLVHTDTDPQKLALYEGMGPAVQGMKLTPQMPAITHPAYESGWPLEHELRAFVEAIREGSHDRSGLEFGCRIVELIAAAHESIEKGGRKVAC